MPRALGTRVDIETLLIAQLSTLDGVNGVETKVPADVSAYLPFIRVQRIGGIDDWDNDTATVDIDTFASDELAAYNLADTVWRALYALYGQVVSGRRIDSVNTVAAPMWVDWQDANIQRYVATYDIYTRII